jgi:hypothetical protein
MKKLRKFENFHILLWLLKDTCWVMTWRTMGMIMIAPTVLLAFFITWKFRSLRSELYHNLAVCSWLVANSVWMTGEFFYNDTTRHAASVFFALGFVFIGWYYGGTLTGKTSNEKIKEQ